MARTDYTYYQNTYLGRMIPAADYPYYSERASERLACFANMDETALKKCECRIAEILYADNAASKNGRKIASESVNGYYSVSYGSQTYKNGISQLQHDIDEAISVYLGQFFGKVRVIQ